MTRTKGLSQEELLTSFLQRASALSSSGLQIDDDGYLYAGGEMIAAWQGEHLFIDCGSSKPHNRKQVHTLRLMAEKEGLVYIPYNEHAFTISREFQFVERMVSYPIWTTPNRVNPKNISAQLQKVLDKAIEKNISLASIRDLVLKLQRVNDLFGFEINTHDYETLLKKSAEKERASRLAQAEYYLAKYKELIAL